MRQSAPPPRKRRARTKVQPLQIVRHRVFVPALAGWGAALGGLSVAILPGALIASIAGAAGLAMSGELARPVLALLAALLVGGASFLAARALRTSLSARDDNGLVAEFASRRLRPIDPASELGSESLDAPLEESEQAQAWEVAEQADGEAHGEAHGAVDGARDEPIDEARELEPFELDPASEVPFDNEDNQPAELEDTPQPFIDEDFEPDGDKLDEAAFASQPGEEPQANSASEREIAAWSGQSFEAQAATGTDAAPAPRDEVWVIGSEAEVDANPARAGGPCATETNISGPTMPQGTGEEAATGEEADTGAVAEAEAERASAIARLRQTPPEELSLVQLVERFAAALHDHQARARENADMPAPASSSPARDAALAEALNTLSRLTKGEHHAQQHGGQPIETVGDTERVLRDALTRLQDMRGAA